jgi:L-fucose isomerase-like protein
MRTNRPRALLVPFGYPDYPRDMLLQFTDASARTLTELGMDVHCAPLTISEKDVPTSRQVVRQAEVDLYVLLLLSWVEAPIVIATMREVFGKPLLLWAHMTFPEGEGEALLGGTPAVGVIRQSLEEFGVPFKLAYGQPEEVENLRASCPFARAAQAVRLFEQARIGLFGYASMGMYTGTFDHVKLRNLLGPEVFHFDQYTLIRRAEAKSMAEAEKSVADPADGWELTAGLESKQLAPSWRLYEALKELAAEHRLDALTVKCQYEMSREWGLAPCLALSILGDEITSSCEGDLYLVVSQYLLHCLTGGITAYGDIHRARGCDLVFGACGFAPMSLAADKPAIRKHTALYEGVYNASPYKEGTVTLARLANKGEGFKLHATVGTVIEPPKLHEVGCPPYSWIQVRIDQPTHHFMQNLSSQHYAIVYGDCREELREFCLLKNVQLILS